MKTKKLNANQQQMLEKLARQPIGEYGVKSILKALAARGLAETLPAEKGSQKWGITEAGCELLNISKAQVEYNYALWALKNVEYEVRHNVLHVWENFEGWRLDHVWSKRSIERNAQGIADYQQAAARLCLAEMRSGLI